MKRRMMLRVHVGTVLGQETESDGMEWIIAFEGTLSMIKVPLTWPRFLKVHTTSPCYVLPSWGHLFVVRIFISLLENNNQN